MLVRAEILMLTETKSFPAATIDASENATIDTIGFMVCFELCVRIDKKAPDAVVK
jgi:hypothetical protein